MTWKRVVLKKKTIMACKISLFPKKISQFFVSDSFFFSRLVIAERFVFDRFLNDRPCRILSQVTFINRENKTDILTVYIESRSLWLLRIQYILAVFFINKIWVTIAFASLWCSPWDISWIVLLHIDFIKLTLIFDTIVVQLIASW